jgi:hypothetical protein
MLVARIVVVIIIKVPLARRMSEGMEGLPLDAMREVKGGVEV